jgi:hypothetical protein
VAYEDGGWDQPAARDPRDPRGASQQRRYQQPGIQPPGAQPPDFPPPRYQRPDYRRSDYQRPATPQPVSRWGGATGNERLTAMTGAVLLVLLLVEGFTTAHLAGRWEFPRGF